jgi:hypothetical protein
LSASNNLTRADGHPVLIVPSGKYFWRLHQRLRERLPIWTIYRPVTREYPGAWVARMFVSLPHPKPTRFVMTHDTLGELREMLPPFLARTPRDNSDAPEIEETWF